MNDSLINSAAITVLGAVLVFLSAWFWFGRQQAVRDKEAIAAEHQRLMDRVTTLEREAAVAASQWIPVASAFQATLIKSLTHAHTGELDDLLVRVASHTLTPAEEPRLLQLLDERTRDQDHRFTEDERKDAMIFPVVMERAATERKLLLAAESAKLRPATFVQLAELLTAADKP